METEATMRRLPSHILLGLLLLAALAPLGAFLLYAFFQLPSPLETYHLEAKFVHFCWRVQHGLPLYPVWRSGPYVSNFFSPLYFLVVGSIGSLLDATLNQLYPIGRAISFLANLGLVAMLALVVKARQGASAAALAVALGLGTAPEYGFAVMARPDVLAEFLGIAGFLLAIRRPQASQACGLLLLVLAALCKQTTLVYLLAASLAWFLEGERKRAAALLLTGIGLFALVVGLVTLLVEPRLLADLFGERVMPTDPAQWVSVWRRAAMQGLDTLLLVAFGAWYWSRRPSRDLPFLALVLVLVPVALLTTAKRVADLNYLLGLRSLALLAAGALWHAASQAAQSHQFSQFLHAPPGQAMNRVIEAIGREAADPSLHVLTYSGSIDIQQGARTLCADPWLFRQLAERGQLDLTPLQQDIEQQRFDRVLTRSDLMLDSYSSYEFGLPPTLLEPLRRHYQPAGLAGQFFFYERKPEATPPPEADR